MSKKTFCNHKAPLVFGKCSKCGHSFQKPFVDWNELTQPTIEDEIITIRAVNRGTYNIFSAMQVSDEDSFPNIRAAERGAARHGICAGARALVFQDLYAVITD